MVSGVPMAAEALDIKSLTSLILATPRTDITQAVGRILRVKHKRPLVIDIVDTHSVFKKQWLKRRKFYEKNKYKTLYATCNEYKKNNLDIIYDPTANKSKKVKAKKTDEVTDIFTSGKCLLKVS